MPLSLHSINLVKITVVKIKDYELFHSGESGVLISRGVLEMLLLMNGWNDGIMWATIIQMFMKKSSAVNAQLWADINGSFTCTARTQSW